MKKHTNMWLRFKRKLREIITLNVILWIVSVGLFLSIVFLLHKYYPRPLNIDGMNQDISLITQILSIVIGISLIGITVHLTSYSLSDKLNALLQDIETTVEPIFERFFSGGQCKHKINSSEFAKYLFRSSKIERLIFHDLSNKEDPAYYVFRPY